MPSGRVGLLSWTIERGPSGSEVTIAGEVDLAVLESLRMALDESLQMDDFVVLNLRDVSFMDSTGLQLLLDLKRKIDRGGGELMLTPVSAAVERVLEVSGMASFFDHVPLADDRSISEVAEGAG